MGCFPEGSSGVGEATPPTLELALRGCQPKSSLSLKGGGLLGRAPQNLGAFRLKRYRITQRSTTVRREITVQSCSPGLQGLWRSHSWRACQPCRTGASLAGHGYELKSYSYTVQPGPPQRIVIVALPKRKRLSADSPDRGHILRGISGGASGTIPRGAKVLHGRHVDRSAQRLI